jgi:hypothetical protein
MKNKKIITLLLCASWGALAQADDSQWGAGVEYFSWREYTSCPQTLEERGPRFFLGLDGANHEYQNWELSFQGKLYAALVVYDGFTQSCVPLTANTSYIGVTGNASATRWLAEVPLEGRRPRIGIRMGLGLDTWRRTIIASGGYSEDYIIGFARVGFAAEHGNAWTAEAGVKRPVSTYEVARLQAAGFSSDAALRPKGDYSYFASIKYQSSPKYNVKIYYDSYRFNRSDTVTIGSCPPSNTACSVHQPTSHQDTIGFTVIANY